MTACRSLTPQSVFCHNAKLQHGFLRRWLSGRQFDLKTKKKQLSLVWAVFEPEWRMQNVPDRCLCVCVCLGMVVCVCVCACGCTLQCHWETKQWECFTGMTSSVWDGVCLVCFRMLQFSVIVPRDGRRHHFWQHTPSHHTCFHKVVYECANNKKKGIKESEVGDIFRVLQGGRGALYRERLWRFTRDSNLEKDI